MQPNDVLHRLTPGDLVWVLREGATRRTADDDTGEIHEVLDQGDRYKVRILTTSTADRMGRFVEVPAGRVQQIGLNEQTADRLRGDDISGLLTNPRVTKYLDVSDRAVLWWVNRELRAAHDSVDGNTAVSQDVWEKIKGNLERLEPPMRPDQGLVGGVTWVTIKGTPHVGIDAEAKDVELKLRTFPDQPVSTLRLIDTPELLRLFELAKRNRLGRARNIADWFTSDYVRRNSASPEAQATANSRVDSFRGRLTEPFFRELDSRLQALPADATAPQLSANTTDIAKMISAHFGDLGGAFVRSLLNERACEKVMWQMVGEIVAAERAQAAVVKLEGPPDETGEPTTTQFSKKANGEFLLVASRRYMQLLGHPAVGDAPSGSGPV